MIEQEGVTLVNLVLIAVLLVVTFIGTRNEINYRIDWLKLKDKNHESDS